MRDLKLLGLINPLLLLGLPSLLLTEDISVISYVVSSFQFTSQSLSSADYKQIPFGTMSLTCYFTEL